MIDCIDYVITHKPYPIQQDDLYRTLCVGDYQEESALSERTGKNISVYNDRLNEVTGLYWIWNISRVSFKRIPPTQKPGNGQCSFVLF